MSKTDDGGPAFPVGSGDMRDPIGMSLRDYFAAAALPFVATLVSKVSTPECFEAEVARGSYYLADAMLAEKKRRETEPK